MGMHHRLAVGIAHDIAVEGGDFHFLIDPHHLEGLHRPVGPADHRLAERPDGLEMGIGQVVLAGELRQPGGRVVALLEGDVEGADLWPQFGRLHPWGMAIARVLGTDGIVGRQGVLGQDHGCGA